MELDEDQWADVCKAAGMKGLILTCKHHDGFCLWPSSFTEHSVKRSPWKAGCGDVVRETSEACRRSGLKFGIYLSPWDRHEKTYGEVDSYNEFFKNQLRELLTNYGEIFYVWFDGACGEGPNGKRQVYDWDSYYSLIRELQPGAVISVCGPDVRWCGNEAGHCRESEWSVVPASLLDAERIAEKSQKEDSKEFSKFINSDEEDLGSRRVIEKADKLVWYPAEVNTSIRPGWFYHKEEDDKVKSVDELLQIYHSSVGGNANFLLNIPPDPRGLIHENDVRCLRELGEALRQEFRNDLAENAAFSTEIAMDLNHETKFDRVVLGEDIRCGQRVESFILQYLEGDNWKLLFTGTVIGHKKICCFPAVTSRYLKLSITLARSYPIISHIHVFNAQQETLNLFSPSLGLT